MEYHHEKEETLSLCDLKIYSDDPMPSEEESILSSFSSSSSSLNQDFFGSFREERSSASSSVSTNPSADDLISSGKTIHTPKQHVSGNHNEKEFEKNKRKKSLFRWNSDSFYKSFNSKRASSQPTPLRSQSLPVPERKNDDNGRNSIMVQRASKFVCPSKSRWQVFVLGSGSGRFPVKMELSDIRNRQLKGSPSTMFRWQDGGEEEEGDSARRRKRLWGLIRVLGCGGGFNTEEIIKASSWDEWDL